MFKVELTKEEVIFLRLNLHNINAPEELINKLHEAEEYIPSANKQLATKKATEVRSKKAKEKIQNAINLLQLENKPITLYSIANTSGVSYNTVKKHIPDIDKIGKL